MKRILIYTHKVDGNIVKQKLLEEYEIIVCHSFDEAMGNIKYKVPALIISDYHALRNNGSKFHYALDNDFIMIDIPVIAIGYFGTEDSETISFKQKIYALNIKRYVYLQNEKDNLQEAVKRELDKWNPHLGSSTHRFVKSFLLFANSKKHEQRMRTHLNYILSHYPLSNVAYSDIRFASAILSTTFTTQDYKKVVQLYTNMQYAPPILQLLKNVMVPTTLEEEILSSVYMLELHLKSVGSANTPFPAFHNIRSDIIDYLHETYIDKRYLLQSYKDIIPFWEEISNLLLKKPVFVDDEISQYLEKVQECLMIVLIEFQQAYLQIIDESEMFTVQITPIASQTERAQVWLNKYENEVDNITFKSDKSGILLITLQPKMTIVPQNKKVLSPHEDQLLRDAHGVKRYSAAEYIHDLGGVSGIADELSLMDEIMVEIFHLLDEKNDLGHEVTRKNLIKCIHEYRDVLQNKFYEFQAIALTLLKLENLLEELSDSVEINLANLRQLLKFVFDDIGSWKTTVFERQAVDDINYLDSSILSSSLQIESLFLPPKESEEDECEFF